MSDFESFFNQQEASEKTEFKPIPQGEYDAQLVEASIDMTKETPMVKWNWEVLSGPQKGSQVKSTQFLNKTKANGEPSPAIGIFKGQLKTLGHEHVEFGKIPDVLDELTGKKASIYVSHYTTKAGKTFCNVSPNHLLVQSNTPPESDDSEEIPF